MNCRDFELNVLRLPRNRLMDAAARELSLAHAEDCVRCADRLAAERALIAGVRAVVTEISGEEAPERVETALLAAFREHVLAGASPTVKTLPKRSSNWTHWRLAAAAAMILILISVMATFWLQSHSSGETQKAITSAPITPQPASAPLERQDETVNHLANRRPQVRPHQRAFRGKSHEAEVVTEFYPLVDGEDLHSLEVVQVVRVELPGSALRAAGLSVGPEMASEPVKADVMLGYDGLARAIRFVR